MRSNGSSWLGVRVRSINDVNASIDTQNLSVEKIKRALAHNAAALILAHNHPSGVAEPSQADRTLTRRLADALALVDVRVLDHFIVAGASSLSFMESGQL